MNTPQPTNRNASAEDHLYSWVDAVDHVHYLFILRRRITFHRSGRSGAASSSGSSTRSWRSSARRAATPPRS
jgi:hypothetical protein